MILQTLACGRTDGTPPPPVPEPCIERWQGDVLYREYPLHIARVREIKRREAGEIVR